MLRSIRVCFFGDSFVNGTGDDECLGWVGRVGRNARRRGHDLTVYNLGVRRETSADIAIRWRGEAERRLPPEQNGRLVFAFGANDGVADGDRPRIAPAVTLAAAEAILGAARAWLPTLMLGPLPVGDAAADARAGALCHALSALCGRLGVDYLPVLPVAAASPVWRREVAAGDGAHPNAGGYALIADAVDGWPPWRAWVP